MLMVGGLTAIPVLASAYAKLTFIDTSAFMKAVYRQYLFTGNDGNILGVTERTEPGDPVDDLLVHNIRVMRTHVERIISESQSRRFQTGSEPTPGSLEMGSSGRSARDPGRAASR